MVKTMGVLTSGGDAPGMNAAVRAVTRSALARGYQVYGIRDGFKGLVNGDFIKFERSSVSDILNRGGTFLGSARMPEFVKEEVQNIAIEQMKKVNMDALVVIGGDGTYRGGYDLAKKGINVVGIPATIDNDVVGTEYAIGFYTALNTIVEAIDKLRDTSASHHRCSIVEVMGNKCGDLALYSGICVGAEVIIIPEGDFREEEVLAKICYLDKVKKEDTRLLSLRKNWLMSMTWPKDFRSDNFYRQGYHPGSYPEAAVQFLMTGYWPLYWGIRLLNC